MHVRAATPADAHGMAEVHVRGWQVGYAGIVAEEILARQSVEAREEDWRGVLTSDVPYPPFVAEQDETVIGIVGFAAASMGVTGYPMEGLPEDIGEITVLYVKPDSWNRGVGAALLAAAESALHEAGFSEGVLWTLRDAARTRRFYENHGWNADGASTVAKFVGTQIVRYRKRFTSG